MTERERKKQENARKQTSIMPILPKWQASKKGVRPSSSLLCKHASLAMTHAARRSSELTRTASWADMALGETTKN